MAEGRPAGGRYRVVAIDGPAGSGKSTTARAVARRLGFVHLNSGLLYRAITWRALREGLETGEPAFEERVRGTDIALTVSDGEVHVQVDGEDPGSELSGRAVSERVSAVSARPIVRAVVLARLREAGERFDLVCDGRDIGTTVFPRADVKVFLVAAARERARRRLLDVGVVPDDEAIEREAARLEARDRADSTRRLSPLRRAPDAVEIDTTSRDPEEVVEGIVALARARGLIGP